MMALQSMGRRQHGDPMAAGGSDGSDAGGGSGGGGSSSIALLQERFRQLQRMRERREEMELMKFISESETMISQTKHYKRSGNLLVHPEKKDYVSNQESMTTRSSFQDYSLSLGLDLYAKKTDHLQPSNFKDFFRSVDSLRVSSSASRAHDKPDVDTSLHL